MDRRRIVFQLHGESFARRYQAVSQAIVAAATGDEVILVLWFDALRRFVEGRFDEPLAGEDTATARRYAELGLPLPSVILAQARGLGMQLHSCETGVRLAGLDPAALPTLDGLLGLQEIHELQAQADLALYI